MTNFGVVITCSINDFLFAKGCCESVRYFMADVPICLLVDGNFPVTNIAKAYNALVINRKDVKTPLLHQRSYGWGLTKMVAFWESPFERFLLLDADTCVWGNVGQYVDYHQYDVILDQPCYAYSEEAINEYFFNTAQLTKLFPDFAYQSHPYVCTGVIFGKRNVFELSEYEAILDLKDRFPHLFKYGEMGLLNFMLFRAKQAGTLRVGTADMQYIVTDFDYDSTRKAFGLEEAPVVSENPTVIHWAGGVKPVLRDSSTYSLPMTYFRRRALQKQGVPEGWIDAMLRKEDFLRELRLQSRYYQKRIRKLITGK